MLKRTFTGTSVQLAAHLDVKAMAGSSCAQVLSTAVLKFHISFHYIILPALITVRPNKKINLKEHPRGY